MIPCIGSALDKMNRDNKVEADDRVREMLAALDDIRIDKVTKIIIEIYFANVNKEIKMQVIKNISQRHESKPLTTFK